MSDRTRIETLRRALPREGFFRDKEWRLSPQAFALEPRIVERIQRLGPALRSFQKACNQLYFLSGEFAWVSSLMDQGKPPSILELGRHERWRTSLPSVIRPDLVLTETGVSISEIDSLPGGIGLTAWLNEMYSSFGDTVIGGGDGMIKGFAAAFPNEDILISKESSDYEPEMRWLGKKLHRSVHLTGEFTPGEIDSPINLYRFFELWDLDNVEHADEWLRQARMGDVTFTPPLKAFLEEKLWLALFWTPQLHGYWCDTLGAEVFDLLRECIPQGWVVDPSPLPPAAELPGLDIHSWEEARHFGGQARELVLKISGFSERGWGSRGVYVGHDLPHTAWGAALDEALQSWPRNPFLLQRFHHARVVTHPMWQEPGTSIEMQSRVRLCPYYFVPPESDDTQLGGVLATVCPADKKILHGMKDAMMLPCRPR